MKRQTFFLTLLILFSINVTAKENNSASNSIPALIYSGEVIEITSPTELDHVVTVMNRGTLIIKSEVYIKSENVQIKVEYGGMLILDGGTITTHGEKIWRGIDVDGMYGIIVGVRAAYYNPGVLIMKNSARIEYARAGIYTWGAGNLKINNGIFYNCVDGIKLVDLNQIPNYNTYNDGEANAYIRNSKFITDDKQLAEPNSHIYLHDVVNINIHRNTFTNTTDYNLFPAFTRGTGIYMYNSNANITGTSSNYTKFTGLDYGIYSANTNTNSLKINNCEFKDYYVVGAYLRSVTAPEVNYNNFSTNYIMPQAGLYLEDCSNYQVEANSFYNIDFYGLIINNSSNYNNIVYRNTFDKTNTGIGAYYSNSNEDGSEGLLIRCNVLKNNKQNILVTDGDVRRSQGYHSINPNIPSVSASNVFNEGYLSGHNAFWASNTNFNYTYYYNQDNDLTDPRGFVSSNVTPTRIFQFFDYAKSCPSTTRSGYAPIYAFDDILSNMSSSNKIINELTGEFNSVVDGGNTEKLLGKLRSMTSSSFESTSEELLKISPYLSEKVLLEFMHTKISGYDKSKASVLLANSPLPSKAYMALKEMQLADVYKKEIEAKQTGINVVEAKKQKIEDFIFEKGLMHNELVRYGLWDDTTFMINNSLVNYLIKDYNHESKYLLIPLFTSMGKYDEAKKQISELKYLSYELSAKLQEEIKDYTWLSELIIDLETTSDYKVFNSIVEKNQKELYRLAYIPESKSCSKSRTLLTLAGIDKFNPEFINVPEEKYYETLFEESVNTYEIITEEQITIYPNPVSDELWIEFLLPEGRIQSDVLIYDLSGRHILTHRLNGEYGVEKINLSNLNPGLYILKIGNYNKQISISR